MIESNDKVLSARIVTSSLFIVLAVAGMLFSIYLIYIANNLYMYILAIAFTCLAVVSGFFNIFTAISYYRSYFYQAYIDKVRKALKPMRTFPTVAVIMPVYNEDVRTVETNLLRLKELKYKRGKVGFYLGDDSTDSATRDRLARFCAEHGITRVTREGRKGFKAGNINNIMKHVKEDYIAIFDYDEYITDTNFLIDLMPYFSDRKLAYIQTEKSYREGAGLFADSVSLFDAFFFRFIQQARALNNTAIFAGSCGVINRRILDRIGGMPEYIIEDTFFSFVSHMKGYKNLYIPKVYAVGKPITTFTQLVRQQWRYNYGDTQFLRYFYRYRKPKELTPLTNAEYITHGFGLNYISVVLLLFTLVSVLIVFSAVPFTSITLQQFFQGRYIGVDLEVLGSMAFFLSLIVPVILTKIYFKSVKKGIMILLLNFALVIVRTKAAIAALVSASPGGVWKRQHGDDRHSLRFAIANTKIEVGMAAALAVLCAVAILENNFIGSVWLFWYATLYTLATVFFYRYG